MNTKPIAANSLSNQSQHKTRNLATRILLLAACVPLTCLSATLDFESINGATPVEGMTISNQFQPYYGIRFRRRTIATKFPVIAKFGSPEAAFHLDNGAEDTLSETNAAIFGQFFLTDNAGSSSSGNGIILDFDAPVSQASGYIFDIDGTEQVTVVAYADSNGTSQLGSLVFTNGMPNTGDGRATLWSFSRPTKDILRIDIQTSRTSGSAPNGINVGYDNFLSDYTPPPQSPANLNLRMYPGLTIQGDVGQPYRIDYADRLSPTNWVALTNLFLPSSPFFFVDVTVAGASQRFYRAVGTP